MSPVWRARSVQRLAGAALAVLAFAALAQAQERRTWTDKTGKYKIEATLKSLVDGQAILAKSDGKEVKIAIKKLSDADQKYIEAHPPEGGDDPFEPVGEATAGDAKPPAAKSAPAKNAEAKLAQVDWSAAQVIPVTPTGDGWKFETPKEIGQQQPPKSKVIPLPPKAHFFEKVSGVAVGYGGGRAAIGYQLDDPKPAGTTRLLLVDIAAGKVLSKASAQGQLAPVALNDQGTVALMRRAEFGFGNSDRLELWNLSPKGAEKTLEWIPYDDAQGGNRDVKWGAFLADERFLTLGGSGRLAVWKANSAEPLYSLQIDGRSEPAVSPDRKYLAFTTGKAIGVLDLQAAEVVALQSTAHLPFSRLCFSPGGDRLACLTHGKLLVWNFADGALYREVPLAGLKVGIGEIVWPHPEYVLLGKSHLFDVESQVPVWRYQGGEAVETIAPGLCAFVVAAGADKPGALVTGPVPTRAFEKALAAAKAQPDFFVLKPGMAVNLIVDSLPDAQQRESVRTALAAKLKERGCDVGPGGTIDLVATAQAGEERDVSYRGFGVSRFKTHKVREYITTLAFVYQGQVTWQIQGSSVPGHIHLKEGETIDQVLRRSEQPDYAFYERAELPQMLMKSVGQGGLGTSRVTVAGVE